MTTLTASQASGGQMTQGMGMSCNAQMAPLVSQEEKAARVHIMAAFRAHCIPTKSHSALDTFPL